MTTAAEWEMLLAVLLGLTAATVFDTEIVETVPMGAVELAAKAVLENKASARMERKGVMLGARCNGSTARKQTG